MKIETAYLDRCITALENAHRLLLTCDSESFDYEMYRSESVKEFEFILEQSGKLLRKVLKPYLHSSKEVDKLYFKDVFRQAVLRSIISIESCERWLEYRDNRNTTAHDYGVNFAEHTLTLLPQFIKDTKGLSLAINIQNDAT
jgi:hypothetical protein